MWAKIKALGFDPFRNDNVVIIQHNVVIRDYILLLFNVNTGKGEKVPAPEGANSKSEPKANARIPKLQAAIVNGRPRGVIKL